MLPEMTELKINKLKNGYNAAMEEENIPNDKRLITEERAVQRIKYIQDTVKSFTTKFEILINDISIDKKAATKKRLSILYPGRSSASPLSKDNGLKQENNALLFLNQSQNADVIVQKLKTAIDLDEYDFSSTIFEKVLMQLPRDSTEKAKLRKNPEKNNLLSKTKALYDTFARSTGLHEVEVKIEELHRLETKANNLLALVSAGEKFVFFPEDYSKMNKEERIKVDKLLPTLPLQDSEK